MRSVNHILYKMSGAMDMDGTKQRYRESNTVLICPGCTHKQLKSLYIHGRVTPTITTEIYVTSQMWFKSSTKLDIF
jgi:hypothetical protein